VGVLRRARGRRIWVGRRPAGRRPGGGV